MYKHPVSVLVVIHTPAMQCLLIERAAHPGFWQSVTGSQEAGEALIDTACREVAEETGYACTPAQLRGWPIVNRFEILQQWRHRYAPGVTHNDEHLFSLCVADCFTPALAPDEHRDAIWLPAAAAAQRCFSWTNQDAIRLIEAAAHTRQGGLEIS